MMNADESWDYSQIPKREWKWHFEPHHWMELEVNPKGLRYIGTDWTVLSGGAYFGGFQTFDSFLKDGGIQEMPDDVFLEVKECIITHRRKGGATLELSFISEIENFRLWRIFVRLDEKPIRMEEISEYKNEQEMSLYKGSILSGDHKISFVILLKSGDDQMKLSGGFEFPIEFGNYIIKLVAFRDEIGEIRVVLEDD
ncbi:MAG: hypothetical protein BAJATHORv1_120056 [Candidatus Thorarchaeota archaeon]|nr:MAG: hypothetical protein BAJATHORv1_120056 [Candidatus Thorarchaeota archaeon]